MAHDERIARLRSGEADLALIDVASFVDTAATEPAFGASCVFVLTQRLPMAAHFVTRRPAAHGRPIQGPGDLVGARFGGEDRSRLAAEHRALLRRLGGEDASLQVPMPYEQMFGALAAGEIDVAPDFGGIAARYQRAVGDNDTAGVLRYRDCGVRAYGIGLVASARALVHRHDEISAFLSAAAAAYQAMREDPARVLELASLQLPAMDLAYALQEWREEEAAVVFGYEAAERAVGASDSQVWADTAAWRQEVAGFTDPPQANRLFHPIS